MDIDNNTNVNLSNNLGLSSIENNKSKLFSFQNSQNISIPLSSANILQKDLKNLPLSTHRVSICKRYFSDIFYHTKEELFSFFINIFYNDELFSFIIIFLSDFPYKHPYIYCLSNNKTLNLDSFNFVSTMNLEKSSWSPSWNLSLIIYTLELSICSKDDFEETNNNQIEDIDSFKLKSNIYEFAKRIKPLYFLIREVDCPVVRLFDNSNYPSVHKYDTGYILNCIGEFSYFNKIKLCDIDSLYSNTKDIKAIRKSNLSKGKKRLMNINDKLELEFSRKLIIN